MSNQPEYARAEAKAWARENFRGACNVILPSYTSDLRSLNEAAIRHDVRRNVELGFWGALLVSEAGTTLDEMRTFIEIALDEASGRQRFLLQGVFDTAQDIIDMANDARLLGVDGMLLGHPNSFYPTSAQQVEEYTVEICKATDLAVVLFVVEHSNLRRLDVRGFPADVLDRLTRVDTIVAIKYEAGRQQTTNTYETFRRLQDADVLLSDPMESTAPMWVDLFGMQWMGTSNYEYYGSYVPRLLDLLHAARTRGHGRVLANPAGATSALDDHELGRSQLRAPVPVEVSGLAQRIQRRAASPAGDEIVRESDASLRRRCAKGSNRAGARTVRRLLRRPQPGLSHENSRRCCRRRADR
jgi:4-hydroxy-tetrahydrodipicolinate synthase